MIASDKLGELQVQVDDALSMADIAADIVCDALEHLEGGEGFRRVTDLEADRMRFASADVHQRLVKISAELGAIVRSTATSI